MEWVLLDVGCLHCTAPTRVVSLHDSEAEAEAAQERWIAQMEADPNEELAGGGAEGWFDSANGMLHASIVIRVKPGEVAR